MDHQPASRGSFYEAAVFVLSLGSAYLLFRGYYYPHGSHGQEIPPILALLDPTLFKNDFAVQSFLEPTPRYFYQQIIASLVRMSGLTVETTLFLLNLLAILSFLSAIYFLAGSLKSASRKPSLLKQFPLLYSIPLAVLCAIKLPSWGSQIFSFDAVPSTFAMAMAIWAVPLAIRDRWMQAYALTGCAIVFQFLIGAFMGLALLPGLLIYFWNKRKWLELILPILFWALPALGIYIMMKLNEVETPASFNFFEVFGLYRVPHHWVPSTAPLFHWLSDALLLCGGIVAAVNLFLVEKQRWTAIVILLGMILAALGGILLNYVFVEIYPV